MDDPLKPAFIVASSFWHFLFFYLSDAWAEESSADADVFESLAPEEFEDLAAQAWPFNRVHVLEKDPNIVRFPRLTLPWAK